MQDLLKIGRARFDDLGPGEGAMQIVPRAFGNLTATIVAGARCRRHRRREPRTWRGRVPYVWDNARGALSLGDVNTEAARFLRAKRRRAGVAGARANSTPCSTTLQGQDRRVVRRQAVSRDSRRGARHVPRGAHGWQRVGAGAGDRHEPRRSPRRSPVIDETIDMPWEVDEFRAKFREARCCRRSRPARP